jgi:hypothetical protein
MSVLRARCPRCETLTAVALGDGYQCHACGAEFAAGLVRVPRVWGAGGEAMADAASLPLPYVALDADVLEPGEIACFMPEPGGPRAAEVEGLLRQVAAAGTPLVGMGVTGLRAGASPDRVVALVTAAGL